MSSSTSNSARSRRPIAPVTAGSQQRFDLVHAEWLYDPLRQSDVLQSSEGAALQVVQLDQPVEEAAHLPEVAVAGLEAVLGVGA